MQNTKDSVVVLLSGSGSNFQAIIDASKNKVLVKQGEKSLLAELVVDDNVSDDCIYIINSNKEHYELGKQYEPIIIENV